MDVVYICPMCSETFIKPRDVRRDKNNPTICCSHHCGMQLRRRREMGCVGYLDCSLQHVFYRGQYNAKVRGLLFTVDKEDLWNLWIKQQGRCAITGARLEVIKNRDTTSLYKTSLDRIDSSKGYTKDNVQLLCAGINMMKRRYSDEMVKEFLGNVLTRSL